MNKPTQQQIIQNWLKDNLGGHTPREISNGTGILIGNVRSHLTSLVAAGCLLIASYDGPGKNKRYCWTSHCNPVPDRKRPPRQHDNPKKFKSAAMAERHQHDFEARERARRKASKPAYTGRLASGYQHVSIKDKLAAALANGQRGIDSEETARQIKAAEYHTVKG